MHKGGGHWKGQRVPVLRGVVYMTKSIEDRESSLGNTTRGSMKGGKALVTFNTKGARPR